MKIEAFRVIVKVPCVPMLSESKSGLGQILRLRLHFFPEKGCIAGPTEDWSRRPNLFRTFTGQATPWG
jgi:hypothetical protein